VRPVKGYVAIVEKTVQCPNKWKSIVRVYAFLIAGLSPRFDMRRASTFRLQKNR
jgi:hypothetical protein